MLSISAAQQAVLNAGVQAEFVRASIKDAGGTYRDLTVYPGFNAVKSVQWSEQIDDAQAKFTVVLFRELYALSLSPYMGGSALNRGFNPSATPAALVAVNRELKIEVAIVPMDTQPGAGDWFEVFRGRVETVDSGSDFTVQLTGQGLASRLAQQYIKVERVYSFAADGGAAVALRVWEANQVYAAGEYILPASRGAGTGGTPDPGFNKFLKVHTGGTSGTTEPIWTTGAGQTDGTCVHDYIGAPSTSGNPVEQVMQNILDNNKGVGDSTVTLFVPTSPLWQITQFIQQREFTMDAVVALAQQIGWDLRYKWRSATSQFELTLSQPQRTSPSVLFTFGPSDYGPPTTLKVDVTTIRNAIRVWYGDASDLWPDGTPKRKPVEVSDSSSITKYSELWMEIQEDQTAQIDSGTEASALANAALSDLREPTAELAVPLMRGFPWVELNDYYTFSANALHFDNDQSLAVTQYQHTFESGKLKSSLQLRGLPTIGAKTYLRKRVQPKSVPPKHYPHQVVHFNGPQTPSAQLTSVVGGQRVQLSQPFDKRQLPEEYEHHVYTTPGTALSSATLKTIAKDRVVEFADLVPNKQHYHRMVARYRNADRLVRGQPSVEVGFLAGRASAGHVSEGIALGDMPLNGGFETRFDPAGMPDHWTVLNGSFPANFDVMNDANGVSGSNYLKVISAATLTKARSAIIPLVNDDSAGSGVRPTQRYLISCWVKTDSVNGVGNNLLITASGVDYQGNTLGDMGGSGAIAVAAQKNLGLWARYEAVVHCDGFSTMRGVYVYIAQDTNGFVGTKYYVDEIRLRKIGSPWYIVGQTTKATDSVESVPGFAGTWVNFDAGPHSQCAFRRDQNGKIWLKGMVKNGVIGTAIFVLPPTFRPKENVNVSVVEGGAAYGRVEIDTSGNVIPLNGTNSFISLDNISWERWT